MRPRLNLRRRHAHKFVAKVIGALGTLYNNPKLLPELGDRRSERREAVVLLLQALMFNCDLLSLRVGAYKAGGFVGTARKWLCGLGGLSLTRLDRGIGDLERAGIITSAQPVEEYAPGKYLGHTARRKIAIKLFRALGLNRQLDVIQRKIYKRRRQAAFEQEQIEIEARRRAMMPEARALAQKKQKQGEPPPVSEDVARAMLQIRHEHPEWDSWRQRRAAHDLVLGRQQR